MGEGDDPESQRSIRRSRAVSPIVSPFTAARTEGDRTAPPSSLRFDLSTLRMEGLSGPVRIDSPPTARSNGSWLRLRSRPRSRDLRKLEEELQQLYVPEPGFD